MATDSLARMSLDRRRCACRRRPRRDLAHRHWAAPESPPAAVGSITVANSNEGSAASSQTAAANTSPSQPSRPTTTSGSAASPSGFFRRQSDPVV